jgi:hypothetical protein
MTLDRDRVFNGPMKYMMPISGTGNKVLAYDTSSNHKDNNVDNAILQAQIKNCLRLVSLPLSKSEKLAVLSFFTLTRLQGITGNQKHKE